MTTCTKKAQDKLGFYLLTVSFAMCIKVCPQRGLSSQSGMNRFVNITYLTSYVLGEPKSDMVALRTCYTYIKECKIGWKLCKFTSGYYHRNRNWNSGCHIFVASFSTDYYYIY